MGGGRPSKNIRDWEGHACFASCREDEGVRMVGRSRVTTEEIGRAIHSWRGVEKVMASERTGEEFKKKTRDCQSHAMSGRRDAEGVRRVERVRVTTEEIGRAKHASRVIIVEKVKAS